MEGGSKMTQEDKELLVKDLSARLTYNVKAYVKNWSKLDRKYYEGVYTVESIHPSLNNILAYSEKCSVEVIVGYDDYEIKPYLFPLSSMTGKQIKEYEGIIYKNIELHCERYYDVIDIDDFDCLIDFYHKYHLDYRGLIRLGLAIDATGLNIY